MCPYPLLSPAVVLVPSLNDQYPIRLVLLAIFPTVAAKVEVGKAKAPARKKREQKTAV